MTKTLNEFFKNTLIEFFDLSKSNGLKITGSKQETFDKFMSEANSKFTKLSKEKKPKDKNAPKRGKSAYNFFCSSKREDLKEENPKIKPNDIMGELGKLWKKISDEEKADYQKMADEDKLRYQTEKEKYEQGHTSSSESSLKKKVKKSKSGYQIFSDEKRIEIKENNPEINPKDVMKELGKMWSELDDEEKAVYDDKAKKLKEKDSSDVTEEKKKTSKPVDSDQESEEVEAKPKKKVSKKTVESDQESEEVKPKKKTTKK